MKLRLLLLVLGLAFALTLGPANVFAAKGVKKKGEHTHHGVVVSVGSGKVTIKTHHHHKKKKQGATKAPAKNHEKTFTTSKSTKVEIAKKGQHQPTSLGALKKGEHVTIEAKKDHADKIVIHHHHKKKKKK